MSDLVKRLRESGSRSEVELHEDRDEAADRIEELESQLANANMRAIAADSQAQMAYEAQEALEAQLAEVTSEYRNFENEVRDREQDFARKIGDQEVRAETYRAAIPVAYQMALEAGAVELDAQREDSYVSEAISKRICCNGYDCGCKGADVGSWLTYVIRALTTPADLVEQVVAKVKGETT